MRLSGAMDGDQGVAVDGFCEWLERREHQRQRCSSVALADDARAGRQHRLERRPELFGEAARGAVWGIYEHEIVMPSLNGCVAQERKHRLAAYLGVQLERREIAAGGGNRGR